MSDSVRTRIETLRSDLNRHNRLYYVDARPEISDLEFDRLLKELTDLETAHPEFDSPDSPTRKVGGTPIDGFVTVEHRLPMLSIENGYTEGEVREWFARIQKLLPPGTVIELVVEYKVDGVALALVYEQGRLTLAITRGDGRRGDDVTHNARTMGGVPLRLDCAEPPARLEVRGEAYIANSDFQHIRAAQVAAGDGPAGVTLLAQLVDIDRLVRAVEGTQSEVKDGVHGHGKDKGIRDRSSWA